MIDRFGMLLTMRTCSSRGQTSPQQLQTLRSAVAQLPGICSEVDDRSWTSLFFGHDRVDVVVEFEIR